MSLARQWTANLLALAFLAAAVHAALARAQADKMVVWVWTPLRVTPDGFRVQADTFRSRVPKGSALFLIQDVWDPWQFGLWQRILYPDYVVISIPGTFIVNSPDYKRLRQQYRVEYAISAGTEPPDPGFAWRIDLPDYPGGVKAIAGKLR